MVERFPERSPNSVQQATLCFLIDGEKVLLALKKRGLGVDRWNGVGGKVLSGEGIKEAALREAREEIGVHVVAAKKVALLHFYFPDDPAKSDWNQDVHVFLVRSWMGKPQESEEVIPNWFAPSQLKYLTMWDDDKHWLPRVLDGEVLEGWIRFDDNDEVLEYQIKNVEAGGKIPTQR